MPLCRAGYVRSNARIHGTTGEVPATRLVQERQHLQYLPSPYRGRFVRELPGSAPRKPVMAYQHPLSIYEDLFA